MSGINRRRFIQDSTALAAGTAALTELGAPPRATASGADPAARKTSFASRWSACPDRIWLGPEFWANPLQDWRVAGGRIECTAAAADRNVHLLTRDLADRPGEVKMSVRIGRAGGGALSKGRGSAGFRIGIMGPLREYRNSLIFGRGLNAGIASDGALFIGAPASVKKAAIPPDTESIELRLFAAPNGKSYTITLAAHDPKSGKQLAEVRRDNVSPDHLVGNVALVANFSSGRRGRGKQKPRAKAAPGRGNDRFWFADWRLEGSKVDAHDDRAFGPILFSQYTLSGGTMKMTAQLPPIGEKDSRTVRLQLRDDESGDWRSVAEEKIHPQARTATFRIEKWNDKAAVPYRLAYTLLSNDGEKQEHHWAGTVRRDPVDQPVLTVADVSCNIHAAFPNHGHVANMAKLDPDLIAFTGDQFYESTGGYGIIRKPVEPAIIDYLRKWFMHGWTWRELTRDRPSISIPDDHDVYQGNIWGEKGAPREGTQEMGGYDMHADWVNVVHRTQTSHHPDPYDPTPVKQDITVYYGPMTYGRVSFAILADRQFKTGPEGVVPPTKGRGDHVTDPDFDPKTADVPGAELLGERQMKFLRDWAADFRGADMKAVISQTIFTSMATTHGGNRMRLRADYDTNGWPQTARNEALRAIRKCFAVHIAGDQHLPALVHYGIDEHRDGPVAFAGPAVNVGYPRWWEPEEPGKNRKPGAPENTGDFTDHLGHPLTVLAVKNGAETPRGSVPEVMQQKASGLGIVRFDKKDQKITFECWPYLADPTKDEQFPGWPVTVNMQTNYGRQAKAELPTLEVTGIENPLVQVIEEKTGEIVYTLRIAGRSFQPKVFAPGKYTIRVSEPESGRMVEREKIEASKRNSGMLRVAIDHPGSTCPSHPLDDRGGCHHSATRNEILLPSNNCTSSMRRVGPPGVH